MYIPQTSFARSEVRVKEGKEEAKQRFLEMTDEELANEILFVWRQVQDKSHPPRLQGVVGDIINRGKTLNTEKYWVIDYMADYYSKQKRRSEVRMTRRQALQLGFGAMVGISLLGVTYWLGTRGRGVEQRPEVLPQNNPPAAEPKSPVAAFKFDVSPKFQPDFQNPHVYTQEDMDQLTQEVLAKMGNQLGEKFDRTKVEHVKALAKFFHLLPEPALDRYSASVGVPFFADVEAHRDSNYYPQDENELVIGFYWRGLVRLYALHRKIKVVNDNKASEPKITSGKVSDVAEEAMFYKERGGRNTVAGARKRYSAVYLNEYLGRKGLPEKSSRSEVRKDFKRLLLVEDEPAVLQMEIFLIHQFDPSIQVETAKDGQEAWEKFERGERFDAIFSDVHMPRKNGITLAQDIHRIDPSTVVALWSALYHDSNTYDSVKPLIGKEIFASFEKPPKDFRGLLQQIKDEVLKRSELRAYKADDQSGKTGEELFKKYHNMLRLKADVLRNIYIDHVYPLQFPRGYKEIKMPIDIVATHGARDTSILLEILARLASPSPGEFEMAISEFSRIYGSEDISNKTDTEVIKLLEGRGVLVEKGKEKFIAYLRREIKWAIDQALAEIEKSKGPEPYQTWMRQGVTIEVKWTEFVKQESHFHKGTIDRIANAKAGYPIIWLSGLPYGIYINRITEAKPVERSEVRAFQTDDDKKRFFRMISLWSGYVEYLFHSSDFADYLNGLLENSPREISVTLTGTPAEQVFNFGMVFGMAFHPDQEDPLIATIQQLAKNFSTFLGTSLDEKSWRDFEREAGPHDDASFAFGKSTLEERIATGIVLAFAYIQARKITASKRLPEDEVLKLAGTYIEILKENSEAKLQEVNEEFARRIRSEVRDVKKWLIRLGVAAAIISAFVGGYYVLTSQKPAVEEKGLVAPARVAPEDIESRVREQIIKDPLWVLTVAPDLTREIKEGKLKVDDYEKLIKSAVLALKGLGGGGREAGGSRQPVEELLITLGRPALPDIRDLAEHGRVSSRTSAVRIFAGMASTFDVNPERGVPPDEVLKDLLKLARDSHPLVRNEALEALTFKQYKGKRREIEEIFKKKLSPPRSEVRSEQFISRENRQLETNEHFGLLDQIGQRGVNLTPLIDFKGLGRIVVAPSGRSNRRIVFGELLAALNISGTITEAALYRTLGDAIEDIGPGNKKDALPFFVASAWKTPEDASAQQKIKGISGKSLEDLIAQPNVYVQPLSLILAGSFERPQFELDSHKRKVYEQLKIYLDSASDQKKRISALGVLASYLPLAIKVIEEDLLPRATELQLSPKQNELLASALGILRSELREMAIQMIAAIKNNRVPGNLSAIVGLIQSELNVFVSTFIEVANAAVAEENTRNAIQANQSYAAIQGLGPSVVQVTISDKDAVPAGEIQDLLQKVYYVTASNHNLVTRIQVPANRTREFKVPKVNGNDGVNVIVSDSDHMAMIYHVSVPVQLLNAPATVTITSSPIQADALMTDQFGNGQPFVYSHGRAAETYFAGLELLSASLLKKSELFQTTVVGPYHYYHFQNADAAGFFSAVVSLAESTYRSELRAKVAA